MLVYTLLFSLIPVRYPVYNHNSETIIVHFIKQSNLQENEYLCNTHNITGETCSVRQSMIVCLTNL